MFEGILKSSGIGGALKAVGKGVVGFAKANPKTTAGIGLGAGVVGVSALKKNNQPPVDKPVKQKPLNTVASNKNRVNNFLATGKITP